MNKIKFVAIAGIAFGLVGCGTTGVSGSNPIVATKISSPAPVVSVNNSLPIIATTSPTLTTVTTAPTTIINERGQIEWVGTPPQGLTSKDCSDSSAPMSQKQSNPQICRSLISSNTAVDSGFHDRMVKMTAESLRIDGDYYKRMYEIDRQAAAARRELAN